jgi:hypothetical protein
MSELKVNKISPKAACGTTTLGDSGDTFTIPAGVTITNNGTQTGFGRTGTVDWQTGSIKTATFTAESGKGYFCNTTGGTFEVDLPAGSAGAIVSIQDYNNTFDSNSLTVDPNGSEKINGGVAGDPVTLSTEGQGVTFVYIDSTVGWRSVQDNQFAQIGASASYICASVSGSGNTLTTVCTNYKLATFTGPGTFTVNSVGNAYGSNTVSYTVVAGGGGGASDRGGGGGAGGFREGRTPQCNSWTVSPLNAPAGLPVSEQGYPISIGAGGGGGTTPNSPGSVGSASSFSTISSAGGGGGGDGNGPERDGANGGSGGGGGSGNSAGGAGGTGNTPPVSPAQGTDGGTSSGSLTSNCRVGGGGGGATAAGSAGEVPGTGNGGAGATNNITGSPVARAGGGGGGKQGNPGAAGTGGTGGGGAGGKCSSNGTNGTVNTGGGAGGGGTAGAPAQGDGGTGGSGIVLIRYRFQ